MGEKKNDSLSSMPELLQEALMEGKRIRYLMDPRLEGVACTCDMDECSPGWFKMGDKETIWTRICRLDEECNPDMAESPSAA